MKKLNFLIPAPHKPDGLRPLWILSLFILWTIRRAVIDTSWVFSPNSNLFANLIIYKHGSIKEKKYQKYTKF